MHCKDEIKKNLDTDIFYMSLKFKMHLKIFEEHIKVNTIVMPQSDRFLKC